MDGFSLPYRLDRNCNGGGVMIFVKEDIPSKLLTKHNFPSHVEGLFVELNFRKSKWLLFDQYFFNCIDKALDTYCNYDVLLAEDFNTEDDEPCLSNFFYQHDLYNLKVGICFTNTHFRNTVAVCSGLSDFHKLAITVLKTSFDKNKPCEIVYRDYKNFKSESFNEDLQKILSITQINTCKQFEDTFFSVLNMHAPLKKKLLRANHSQYVTKALRKAIMRTSKLENIYFKKQTDESLKAYKK